MNKLKPALLGGLIVGLLSAIPVVNYCCCIWGIGGGGLASYLYIKSSPTKISTGDGAMLGGAAAWGGVGGVGGGRPLPSPQDHMGTKFIYEGREKKKKKKKKRLLATPM